MHLRILKMNYKIKIKRHYKNLETEDIIKTCILNISLKSSVMFFMRLMKFVSKNDSYSLLYSLNKRVFYCTKWVEMRSTISESLYTRQDGLK